MTLQKIERQFDIQQIVKEFEKELTNAMPNFVSEYAVFAQMDPQEFELSDSQFRYSILPHIQFVPEDNVFVQTTPFGYPSVVILHSDDMIDDLWDVLQRYLTDREDPLLGDVQKSTVPWLRIVRSVVLGMATRIDLFKNILDHIKAGDVDQMSEDNRAVFEVMDMAAAYQVKDARDRVELSDFFKNLNNPLLWWAHIQRQEHKIFADSKVQPAQYGNNLTKVIVNSLKPVRVDDEQANRLWSRSRKMLIDFEHIIFNEMTKAYKQPEFRLFRRLGIVLRHSEYTSDKGRTVRAANIGLMDRVGIEDQGDGIASSLTIGDVFGSSKFQNSDFGVSWGFGKDIHETLGPAKATRGHARIAIDQAWKVKGLASEHAILRVAHEMEAGALFSNVDLDSMSLRTKSEGMGDVGVVLPTGLLSWSGQFTDEEMATGQDLREALKNGVEQDSMQMTFSGAQYNISGKTAVDLPAVEDSIALHTYRNNTQHLLQMMSQDYGKTERFGGGDFSIFNAVAFRKVIRTLFQLQELLVKQGE